MEARSLASELRPALASMPADRYRQLQSQSVETMVTGARNRTLVLDWILASDRETMAQAAYEMVSSDLRASLAGVKSSMLVLGSWHGREALGVSRESVEALFKEQYQGRAQIVVSDSARHFLQLDDPDWVARQIASFVTK